MLTNQPSASKANELKPHEAKPSKRHKPASRNSRAAIHVSIPATSFKHPCLMCPAEKHPLYQCEQFKALTIHKRRDFMKTQRLCFNCLIPGHKTADCWNSSRCRNCTGKHHTLVHVETVSSPQTPAASVNHSASIPDTLLMTSQVLLTGPGGQQLVGRALLDSGSSLTLISSRAAQILRLPFTRTNLECKILQCNQPNLL